VNDTVTFDPRTDEDVGDYFARLPGSDYLPTWYQQRIDGAAGPNERAAAIKAAKDAATPTVVHFDSLGRTVLSVADNGNGQHLRTRSVLDIEGNQRAVIDPLDRVVMRYDYDMLSTRLRQSSMEAGERWMLADEVPHARAPAECGRAERQAEHRPDVVLELARLGPLDRPVARVVHARRELVGDEGVVGCQNVSYRPAGDPQRPDLERLSSEDFCGDGLGRELEVFQCNRVGVGRVHWCGVSHS